MNYGGFFDYDGKQERLAEVNQLAEDPAIWNDAKRAQDLGRERKSLEDVVLGLTQIGLDLDDAAELFEMAQSENDEDSLLSIVADVHGIEQRVAALEFRRMFSNPADPNNCFIDIQAGAGGTEACDWAQMLLRQYLKYCERKGYGAELLEESPGDVAGIKSATLKIEGDYAFGHLRTETGVHRLVRKSPFDSSGGRHTSPAATCPQPGHPRGRPDLERCPEQDADHKREADPFGEPDDVAEQTRPRKAPGREVVRISAWESHLEDRVRGKTSGSQSRQQAEQQHSDNLHQRQGCAQPAPHQKDKLRIEHGRRGQERQYRAGRSPSPQSLRQHRNEAIG